MLMIWRGWAGGLGILCLVLGAGLGASLGGAIGGGGVLLCAGFGLILGGVGAYFLGQYANQTQPQQKVEEFTRNRHHELHSVVEQGRFSLGPGHAAPRSLQEAHQQADHLLGMERAQMSKALVNRHHVWFVPAQYWGFIGAGIGLILIVAGLIA